jgi:plastocyanin
MAATRPVLVAAAVAAVVPSAVTAQASVEGDVRWGGRPAPEAAVWLVPAEGTNFPPPSDRAVIDQSHLRFVPRVLPVQVGTIVEFPNSDPIMHNVFSPERRGAGFDLGTYAPGEQRSFTFGDIGVYVVLCHVHPEMVAWVIVVPTPYIGVTGRDGEFRIEGVPPGSYRMRTWYRRAEIGEEMLEIGADQDRVLVHISGPQRGNE